MIFDHITQIKNVQEVDNEDFYYGGIGQYLELNNFKYKFYTKPLEFSKNDNSFFFNECNFLTKLKMIYKIVKTSICLFSLTIKNLNIKSYLKFLLNFFQFLLFITL